MSTGRCTVTLACAVSCINPIESDCGFRRGRLVTGALSLCRHLLVGISALSVLSGCIGKQAIKSVESPDRPVALASTYAKTQKNVDEGEYQKRIVTGDFDGARVMRD